jgi:DNA-directed RNA polymerase subunit RPC12/RpoP
MALEYRCAGCGGNFESTRPDEEATAECDKLFGKDCGPRVVVCEDCWQRMSPTANPEKHKEYRAAERAVRN